MKKYALHAGEVLSKNDDDMHYVSAIELARLYKLKPNEWVEWGKPYCYGKKYEDYIHLYPRFDGDYNIKE